MEEMAQALQRLFQDLLDWLIAIGISALAAAAWTIVGGVAGMPTSKQMPTTTRLPAPVRNGCVSAQGVDAIAKLVVGCGASPWP
jgi:hypothetical protein